MRKQNNKDKIIKKDINKKVIILLIVIVILLMVGGVIAYYSSTDTFDNTFKTSDYGMEVREDFVSPNDWAPGTTTPKTVVATNKGDTPAAVRIKLIPSWEDENGNPISLTDNNDNEAAIINFSDDLDIMWTKDGDYYYYNLPINKNESTSSLIESVTFNPEVSISSLHDCVTDSTTNSTTCSTETTGYGGGTYKLNIIIETCQYDKYQEVWETEVELDGAKDTKKLYDVFVKAANETTYASKYTGEHQDSYANNGKKGIYYFHQYTGNTYVDVKEKVNVLFANKCWQMYRTTDTGGVKLIYNGKPTNNTCPQKYIQYADVSTWFGNNENSLADVGYMYNKRYPSNGETRNISPISQELNLLTKKYHDNYKRVSSNFYVADSVEWIDNSYQLVDPVLKRYYDSGLTGKYTFLSSNSGKTSNSVYFITNKSSDADHNYYVSYLTLTNGNDLSYYENQYDTITYGSSYTKNNDNSYTINNPSTFNTLYNYNNTGVLWKKFVCINAVNNSCNELLYVPYQNTAGGFSYYSTNSKMVYAKGANGLVLEDTKVIDDVDYLVNISNYSDYKYTCNNMDTTCENGSLRTITSTTYLSYSYVIENTYGNSFSYDGTKYTLINTIFSKTPDSSHHYTCLNQLSECTTLYFINYFYNDPSELDLSYIQIEGTTTPEQMVQEMLYADNVNRYSSKIKNVIETWYQNNIYNGYDNFVEDTIYCNSRKITSLGGFDPNNGQAGHATEFNSYNYNDNRLLSCQYDTDKFSTLNPKARTNYKVGLQTLSESALSDFYGNIGNDWLMTPDSYHYYGNSNGSFAYGLTRGGYETVGYGRNVRPVISLIPNIEYTSGDGSYDQPYIINYEKDY